jgi:hypothetical protein
MTCYIHRTIFANPCQIWRQVLETKRQNTSQRTKEKCTINVYVIVGFFLRAIAWNLTALGIHSVPTFRATHSKSAQFTFHFYKCFYKSRHAKKSLAKRISKGQRATTNMKCVRVLFEHCYYLAFFLKRFISTSWLQTRMELQKKIFRKKHLSWVTNQEGSCLGL